MTEQQQKYFSVSWEEFHRDAKALAWRLNGQKNAWSRVIAITRGGLVPAAIVSRELDIRYVDTVCIKTYEEEDMGNSKILKEVRDGASDILIVDDLVDTGTTAQIVREMMPKAHVATVYAKPAGLKVVDTYITQVSQDTWIRFPWDMELGFAKPIAHQGE